MTTLVHELISHNANCSPTAIALQQKNKQLSYQQLHKAINTVAQGYLSAGIVQGDRVGIYLAKTLENVQSIFACSTIGAVFVPVNPVLKAPQVFHIANDCQIKLLITNTARLKTLIPLLKQLPSLSTIVVIDVDQSALNEIYTSEGITLLSWNSLLLLKSKTENSSEIESIQITQKASNLAAILYTSGSTGKPKGIMLSHENIVLGAKSVSQYLEQTSNDVILAVLPLSFDYGLNQLTSTFLVGAKCILLDYLLANDVIKAITHYGVTGLAAVPPLWMQLAQATWPNDGAPTLRYFTNSGGVLPLPTLTVLQHHMPQAKPYLMYGLTEAFRSTFLPPSEITNRPNSIGKAIPHAEILVLREDGSECSDNEVGELVHIGPLVALGYWQNIAASKARFKPTPLHAKNNNKNPLAVFSGDYVKRDEDGFLYFVSRKDAMIKTSGYRVSPNEVESVLLEVAQVEEVAVIPRISDTLGQEIIALIISKTSDEAALKKRIIKHCQLNIPNYMTPKDIIFLSHLPRNPNNKIDTQLLINQYGNVLACDNNHRVTK